MRKNLIYAIFFDDDVDLEASCLLLNQLLLKTFSKCKKDSTKFSSPCKVFVRQSCERSAFETVLVNKRKK